MHNFLDILPATFDQQAQLFSDGEAGWTRDQLAHFVARLCAALGARRAPDAPVAILADNSPRWLAVDLATQQLGLTLVPLPLFFTPEQMRHALASGAVQALFCADPAQGAALGFATVTDCDDGLFLCQNTTQAASASLPGVQKITFTSGTTAQAKGVCLGSAQQWQVAQALHQGLGKLGVRRHLCLLPLAVLLENIAGVYTAMLSGATTICPPLAEIGLRGASQFDPELCLAAIERHQAHSIIVLPQMLQALVACCQAGDARIASLKFVAVGGAKTAPRLLEAARAKGFPVYEGYGLSECCSVVALNLPGADRLGSVGRPLPGRQLRIGADGEIEVGAVAVHYLGLAPAGGDWLGTGDLGHLDDDGFLYIDGRKKDILITGFGRNVSPEWPEAALLGSGRIAQALVLGESQPYLAALIVPLSDRFTAVQIQAAVDQANLELPDYAQVRRWTLAAPFTPANGLATPNGRPRRALIGAQYQQQIDTLFIPQGA